MKDGSPPTVTDSDPHAELGELARRLRRGEEVVGAWFRRAWPLVHRLCRGFTASGVDADDLAQDAMVHLHDHIDRWDPERSYVAWQRAVVCNLCRNARRAAGRRRHHEDGAAEERMSRPQSTPLQTLERAEVGEVVDRLLAVLPPREREAFVLCDLEGLRPVDAADVMGVADSTVRAALTLARRRMREALARTYGQGGAQ